MHSVLFLILAFFNAAGLFVLLGAEFLAMILIVVYVGAVAVLFLFVVMMLDVDFAELRQGFLQYLPIGATDRASCCWSSWCWWSAPGSSAPDDRSAQRRRRRRANDATPRRSARILYTRYVFYFQAAGLVLLVAMIGAIVLTLRHKAGVKRQDIAAQVARTQATADRGASRSQPGQGLAMTIGLGHYLTVAAILFTLGIFGIFLNRKNVIVILMSIELILLAVNINFVAFSAFLGDLVGQVFALFVLTVAAAEAAIGLAILVVYFRNRGSIAVEDINLMKG